MIGVDLYLMVRSEDYIASDRLEITNSHDIGLRSVRQGLLITINERSLKGDQLMNNNKG